MKKRHVALALVSALMLAGFTGMSVYATGSGSGESTVQAPSIKNSVIYPDGVTFDKTFVFSFTQVDNGQGQPEKVKNAAVPNVSVRISDLDVIYEDGARMLNTATKYGEINLNALDVPGMYSYEVTMLTADAIDAEGYGWDCNADNSHYKVRVYVTRKDDGTLDRRVTFDKAASKVAEAEYFSNFTKKSPGLTISKSFPAGDTYGDVTKEFNFELRIFRNGFDSNTQYVGSIVEKNGSVSRTVNIHTGNEVTEFMLKAGQKLVIDNVPAGTFYALTEKAAVNYVPSFIVQENGQTFQQVTGTVNTALPARGGIERQDILIGENANSVSYTNTFREVSVTGVITNIAPFVMMMLAAAAAVALYLYTKRRLRRS